MFFLVYASSALKPFTAEELRGLLEGSRRRNLSRGITGMLLYKDGNFLEVLEGEKPVVTQLFQKIKSDPRHHGILLLLQDETPERQFPDYSMGFQDLNSAESRAMPGYSEFLNTPLTGQEFSKDPTRAQKLLLLFKRNMR